MELCKEEKKYSKRRKNQSKVEYDWITGLPTPILHHILSLIPTRDVIRTSVLNKRWRCVCNSLPILDFDCSNFFRPYSSLPFPQIIEDFMNMVDKSLLCREPNTIIDKFRLVLDDFEVEFTHRVNKWIEFVVESNVKELDLNICTDYDNEERIYGLPLSLFDAKSTEILRLEGFKLVPSGVIRFSSLRSLSLIGMYIDDQIIRDLIFSCPLIEILILQSCFGLGHLQVSSPQIKTLEMDLCCGLQSVEIDAPSLQSFLCVGYNYYCKINATGFSYLKTISLEQVDMTEEFQMQISQCPLLESLKLDSCNCFGSFRISNQQLKSLVLDNCVRLLEAEIETQNLLSFTYAGNIIPFALMNTSSLLDATLNLSPHPSWFSKLRDFLGRFDHVKVLTLVDSQCMIIPKKMRKRLLPPLYHLEHLKAELESPVRHSRFPRLDYFSEQTSLEYAEYLEGLLWCSPRLKTLDLVFLNRTLKFHYKKLTHSNSCKSIPIGSWKQCLEKVKIENFEGTKDDYCILKFLLENAKALEKIQCISNLQILPENYMELNRIRIASPHAKIVYC